MSWWKHLKGKVRLNEPLKKHTTFKIGGPAKLFVEPKDTDDLRVLLNLLKRYKIRFLLIGGGSNLLINDKGVSGAVISLCSPYFQRVQFKGSYLEVGSAANLNRVISDAKRYGLSGAEFLAGIPGTMGGALVMNAGISEKVKSKKVKGKSKKAKVKNIADLVTNVTVMDYDGKIKILDKKDIKFAYRRSNLSKYIILSARIKLVKRDRTAITDKINTYLRYRKLAHDLSKPSAGCIFKNPVGHSAGKLIDLCGLKGKSVGDACISQKHANFILNKGYSRARDVLKLMRLIEKKVKKKFKINLKPEIKIWN